MVRDTCLYRVVIDVMLQSATKRLSIRKLPPVLSFQFKVKIS